MATKRTKKQKPSNNGLWIGSGISAGIVILIGIALFFKFQGPPPDNLSGGITEANLAKQTLKTEGLPKLGDAPGGSGSLNDLLDTIASAKNVLRAGGFEDEKKAKSLEVIRALHGAAASNFTANMLDNKIPEKRFESPEIKRALQALGTATRKQVDAHIKEAQFEQAQGIAVSYLSLGEKVFRQNTRLKSRQRGLAMMNSALKTMDRINLARHEDGAIDEEALAAVNSKVTAWKDAIKSVENAWNSKLKSIETVSQPKSIPNIADLIKVAKEDEDPTFRIFGALRLGYALYERGGKGNQNAIKKAIEELKNDSEKRVADAAAAGESIADQTEYHKLK